MKKIVFQRNPLILHAFLWILYYISFGIIWTESGDYKSSFFREFILLPIRIFCVYFTVLYLLPNYLLKKKFDRFLSYYIITLLLTSILQRIFIYFFIDDFNVVEIDEIFKVSSIFRAVILINSTVILVLSIYILKHYFKLNKRVLDFEEKKPLVLQLKSNKRIYNINENDVIHIEGLGNYVKYYLKDDSSILVYGSLKQTLKSLSNNFIRIHKSHIINKNYIKSYSNDNIELLEGKIVPIGASVIFKL